MAAFHLQKCLQKCVHFLSHPVLSSLKICRFSVCIKAGVIHRTSCKCTSMNRRSVHRFARCLQDFHSTGNPLRLSRCVSSTSSPSVVLQESPTDVVQQVQSEIQTNRTRLFAIIFLAGQQFKVTTHDIIKINQGILADNGERICLKKVLLVGGDNFSLIGRPLLSPEQVRVEATVIEKTKGPKTIVFKQKPRTHNRKYREVFAIFSVLRINSIEVAPTIV